MVNNTIVQVTYAMNCFKKFIHSDHPERKSNIRAHLAPPLPLPEGAYLPVAMSERVKHYTERNYLKWMKIGKLPYGQKFYENLLQILLHLYQGYP